MNTSETLNINKFDLPIKEECVFPVEQTHSITKTTDSQGNNSYHNEYGHGITVIDYEPDMIAACLLENFNLHVEFLLDKALEDDSLLPIANNLKIILKDAKQKFEKLFDVMYRDIGHIFIRKTLYRDYDPKDDIYLEAFVKNSEH